MAKLGDICTFYSGTGFPIQYQGNKMGDYPFYKVGDIAKNVVNGNKYLKNCDNYISDEVLKIIKGTIIPENTIVFAKIGEAVKLNRRAITSCKSLVDNNVMGIKPNEDVVNIRYFYQYMLNLKLESFAEATTVPSVKKSVVENIELQLPKLQEQINIVEKLEKVDELISCRKEQLSKLDELVKSRFVEMFGDYKVNNKNFECYKGNELFKFSSGKFLPEEKRFNMGVPVYGGNGIAWYTEEALIDYPTIIIGRVGAQCGNIHTVTEPVWITDNAIFIKEYKIKKHTLEFLTELMKMMDFYQYADFSGQPKITQKPLENSNFIVPPIEEQKKFTVFVEQTEKTKAEVQKSLDELEILKKSLMQKYFG